MDLQTTQESFIQQFLKSHPSEHFLDLLEPLDNLQPHEQLAIYQNNVRGALQSCLSQMYPVCRKILGENYFKQLASEYIDRNPSWHHDLNSYGEFFSDFISQQCKLRNELSDFSYLADLVKLERFYDQVYYAADSQQFDFNYFAQLTEQQQAQCTFQLAPCVKFLRSGFPILTIWQLNQIQSDAKQTIDSSPENCCIFRNNYKIELIKVSSNILQLLQFVSEGETLNKITTMDTNNNFPYLISQGWVDSFEVNDV